MTDRIKKTIQPDEKGWGRILGRQPDEAAGSSPGSASPAHGSLEGAVAGAAFAPAQSGAPVSSKAYPLQLRIDLTDYLQKVLAGKSLPQTMAIQDIAKGAKGSPEEAVAYAHARLLVDILGPEAFDIRNMPKKLGDASAFSGGENYRTMSELRIKAIPARQAQNYVAALLGNGALNSPAAYELVQAPLDEPVELSSLPFLLANAPEIGFLRQTAGTQTSEAPFNSAYSIVMEMQPASTRLLAAKALASAYADGSLEAHAQIFSSRPYRHSETLFIASCLMKLARSLKIPDSALEIEAQKLGGRDFSPAIKSYTGAWESVATRFKRAEW